MPQKWNDLLLSPFPLILALLPLSPALTTPSCWSCDWQPLGTGPKVLVATVGYEGSWTRDMFKSMSVTWEGYSTAVSPRFWVTYTAHVFRILTHKLCEMEIVICGLQTCRWTSAISTGHTLWSGAARLCTVRGTWPCNCSAFSLLVQQVCLLFNIYNLCFHSKSSVFRNIGWFWNGLC